MKSRNEVFQLRKLMPFGLWHSVFYTVWLMIIVSTDGWETLRSHWTIALAMALGSYISGSPPMGGGTVGFPLLVLFFDMPYHWGAILVWLSSRLLWSLPASILCPLDDLLTGDYSDLRFVVPWLAPSLGWLAWFRLPQTYG